MTVKPPRKSLSESLEDYIEAIWFLLRDKGEAHNKDIANQLGVKMPSVTAALHTLQQLGYIHYDRRSGATFTEEGECLARQLAERHELLRVFFTDILLLDPQRAESLACAMEHVIGTEATRRLASLTAYLKDSCFRCDLFTLERYRSLLDSQDDVQDAACTDAPSD